MTGLDRTRRTELLAAASDDQLMVVADQCLRSSEVPEFLLAPEVGTVVLTLREPVESTRMQLGDVLVTRTEVLHRGAHGWAMRMGSNREATVAAAICDAEVEADGPERELVEALCRNTERRLRRERDAEWAELEPTTVHFEEMDS